VLRIIKDYDMYVERNLKRDYTPSDLGISQTKALRIKCRRAWAKSDAVFKSKMDFFTKALAFAMAFYLVVEKAIPYLGIEQVKNFRTFGEFYPFYLSEHQNETCRQLHFVGTSLVLSVCIMDYNYILSTLPALLVGLAVKDLTMCMKSSAIEMAVTFSIYLLVGTRMLGSFTKALALPLLGCGFAWTGHFFYEHNKPAASTYPVYGFISDFRMWYGMLRKFANISKNWKA